MSYYHVEESAVISAPPALVYAVLADYNEAHPAILPKPYFESFAVLEGGNGAGTVFEAGMNVYGSRQTFTMTVSEPEPGRVLSEADPTVDLTTSFTVDPLEGGNQSQVTIRTRGKTSPGLKGLLERLFNPPVMRRIYQAELKQLAAHLQ